MDRKKWEELDREIEPDAAKIGLWALVRTPPDFAKIRELILKNKDKVVVDIDGSLTIRDGKR